MGYLLEEKLGNALNIFMQRFKISLEIFIKITLVFQEHGIQIQLKYSKYLLTTYHRQLTLQLIMLPKMLEISYSSAFV